MTAMVRGFLVLLALAADPALASAKNAPASKNQQVEGRKLTEIGREMSAALKTEATAKQWSERTSAIRELAALHTELRLDPRLQEHDLAKNYFGQITNRLIRVRLDLQ